METQTCTIYELTNSYEAIIIPRKIDAEPIWISDGDEPDQLVTLSLHPKRRVVCYSRYDEFPGIEAALYEADNNFSDCFPQYDDEEGEVYLWSVIFQGIKAWLITPTYC